MNIDEAIAAWERLRELYDLPPSPTICDVLIAEVKRLQEQLAQLESQSVKPPTEEESRAAFETRFNDFRGLVSVQRNEDVGEYQDFVVQKFWAGWQAAINWVTKRQQES